MGWDPSHRTEPDAMDSLDSCGLASGLGAGSAIVGYRTDTGALAVQGAFCGLALGTAQAIVLYDRLGGIACAWPAALAGLWALGWTITASAGVDVEAGYTVFGASGAIVVTAATSVLPIMLRSPQRRIAGADTGRSSGRSAHSGIGGGSI